jgi:hypothetical protein
MYLLDGLGVRNNQKEMERGSLIGGLNSRTTFELAACTGATWDITPYFLVT